MDKKCLICEKKFSARGKYCSNLCRKESRKKAIRKFNKSEKRKILSAKYRRSDKGKISQQKHKPSKKYLADYYLSNSEKIKNRSKKRFEKNKKIILEQHKKYYASLSPEKILIKRKLNRAWKKTEKVRISGRFDSSMRRKRTKQATPKWNDPIKTKHIFDVALKLEKLYNQPFHVDHIIPLNGITFEHNAKVCGLNVYYNLMPVTESVNESKKNFCPPESQLRNTKIKHLSLDKLPKPKDWIKFIDNMYIKASNNRQDKELRVEFNPRKLKNI